MELTPGFLIALALTLFVFLLIGFNTGRKVKDASDFYAGGNGSGALLVAGGIIGGTIGSKIIHKIPVKYLQWLLAVFMIYTGMRIDELLTTASSDVHIEERYIVNRGTKTENAFRLVPIHKDIIPVLEKRLARNGENLLVTKSGDAIAYKQFHTPPFKKFCEEFNLKHTIHETRHSFATYTAHIDSTLRSYMIGHSTGSLTNDVYTHPEVLLPELIAEIDKVDFLNAKTGSK